VTIENQKEANYWNIVALETEKEESAARTDKWRNAARNWIVHYTENKARDFIIQTIENHVKLKGDAQVLDVGCGPGKWVNLFAQRGFATTGIDSSPWMIRLAKKRVRKSLRHLVRFRVMNVASLDMPSNVYDMVNCVTVLQHIFSNEDWRNAVHEMVRVTKPMGHVLIFEAVPSFIFKKNTRHLRFRTMKEYVSEFEKAGAHLTYWRATDLSFPITFLGLRKYAASFSKKVYYYFTGEFSLFSPYFLSSLSRIVVTLAKPIDYRLGETPLSFLSVGKILLFRKV
jgi:2-polyprenyl-3-methyl-5-hydroxy-6-metoxy-1,4-benzoquinol methylase